MMRFLNKKLAAVILFCLAFLTLYIWESPDNYYHIVACDVGQGDAILITHKKTQILIDGGPGNKVLDCLSSHMPFWEKAIELVILTHPEADHMTGVIDVLESYQIKNILMSELINGTPEYEVLRSLVGGGGIRVLNSGDIKNMRMGMISFDILWPSQKYLTYHSEIFSEENDYQSKVLSARKTSESLNNFSIVTRISFGDFDALFTGDIGPEVIDDILTQGVVREVEYLKVPHHGSKNGLTKSLLERSNPRVAVISSGTNNPYGHPHQEVLSMLKVGGTQILRTDKMGDVEVVSDGERYWIAQ